MAAKKTPPKAGLSPEQHAILTRLHNESNANPQGFTHANALETAELVKAGHVLVNHQAVDAFGRVGHKLTDSGVALMAGSPAVASGAAAASGGTAANTSKFELEDGIPIPEKRAFGRPSGNNTTYPFDAMKVGQSFHVAKTDEKPNPAKSLASTISSANNRYAVEIPGETRTTRKGKVVPATKQERKFEVRNAAENDPKGPGARIFRVA